MKTEIKGYNNLINYPLSDQFDFIVPPPKMIELLKEYIPTHCCVGTVWKRDRPVQFEETKKLNAKCELLRSKILEFDFYGSITFKLNEYFLIVRIYFDEDGERKTIEFLETSFVEYEYSFS